MRNLSVTVIICLTTLLMISCVKSKKLDNENAIKTIKEFVVQNSFEAGTWQNGSFSVNSIKSIEPISQFTEDEASILVNFDFNDSYSNETLSLKFIFKRDIDKQWVLTSINSIKGVGSQAVSDLIQKWQDLNIIVNDHPKSNKISFFEKIPKINVRIFERTGIVYDSEGWPYDQGVVKEVKGFNESKSYKKNSESDYIEKIRIDGKTENLNIQVLNSKNAVIFEQSNIILNDSLVFASSDATGQQGRNFQKWMEARSEILKITISYKDKPIFQGIIDCK